MVNETEKQKFLQRVSDLKINPQALESIRVSGLEAGHTLVIPHIQTKLNSLQIYAAITTNDGYIGPDEAKRGLDIFGEAYVLEASAGTHPSIDRLVDIVSSGKKVSSIVSRRESAKPIPVHIREAIPYIIEKIGTPFHVYDADGISTGAQELNTLFSWGNFRNYFAVKALPNPHVLKLLSKEGFGADCSSSPELSIADMVGLPGHKIMFTSNDTPDEEFIRAMKMGAIINLDDITHLNRIFKLFDHDMPKTLCFRYNPGKERTGSSIIGEPVESKYGLTREQMFRAYQMANESGVKHFGLHTMVGSNMLDEDYLIQTGRMVFILGRELSDRLGIKFDFFNLGGGIGTPYKPEQKDVDKQKVSEGIREAYKESGFIEVEGPRVYMENGRAITGPHGWLVSRVRHVTQKHKSFVGLDACMADLARPALYGAYHHISVLGKEDNPKIGVYDVTGSLCENNDKFAINRALPSLSEGDIVVIHNDGAHAFAMGAQYNAKLRHAEVLVSKQNIRLIRRAETEEDYFRTLEFLSPFTK